MSEATETPTPERTTTPPLGVGVQRQVMPRGEQRRVDHAAVLLPDGAIFSVPPPGRHGEAAEMALNWGATDDDVRDSTQGFTDEDGTFMCREEAALVAFRSGQIETYRSGKLLFSEDLW
jgi:hypothetical protein